MDDVAGEGIEVEMMRVARVGGMGGWRLRFWW